MTTAPLTPTSYLVLGFLNVAGPSTPYELKQMAEGSVGYFWSFPHSQLYSEPARLTGLGLASEQREEGGRRRRRFAISAAGRRALREWLADPTPALPEIRDVALLKLFFGGQATEGDLARLAAAQLAAHQSRLAGYVEIDKALAAAEAYGPVDLHPRETLRCGLAVERACIAFWKSVLAANPAR